MKVSIGRFPLQIPYCGQYPLPNRLSLRIAFRNHVVRPPCCLYPRTFSMSLNE